MATTVVNLRHERADVRIDRRGPYGNPFRVDGAWITWTAVGLGYRGDKDGRRAAAIALYRSWMTGEPVQRGGERAAGDQSVIEYGDGSQATIGQHAEGFARAAASIIYPPPQLPDKPPLEPLRGKRLGCWCKPLPCHGDVIVELLGEPDPEATDAG